MGRSIIALADGMRDVEVVSAIVRPGSAEIGCRLCDVVNNVTADVTVTDDLRSAASDADVVVEFAGAEALEGIARISFDAGVPLLSGSSAVNVECLQSVSDKIPVLWAANTCLGVLCTARALRVLARDLKDVGEYDVSIVEHHHRYKKDAPSATALMLGKVVADAVGINFNESICSANVANSARGAAGRSIEFASVRGGTVAGEHSVLFQGTDETIEITHRAFNRNIFALGAIKAAEWLITKRAGFYSLSDILDC